MAAATPAYLSECPGTLNLPAPYESASTTGGIIRAVNWGINTFKG